jgi:cytochrome c-type protein NapC
MSIGRLLDALRKPPKPGSTLGRLIGVVAGGVVLVGLAVYGLVFYPLLEVTNSTEFCVSCHSMQETVYKEYKTSLHYANPSGVRVGCPDCHVPKQLGPKLVAKIRASKDVWHEMLGTIDTPEKFEAHRWRMASTVWAMLERTDSGTCRSCHSWASMDLEAQDRFGRRRHQSAMDEGKTCIECHKGLVHKLPQAPAAEAVAPDAPVGTDARATQDQGADGSVQAVSK